ncbi:MAG TPA: hypothetical protein VFG23_01000, partial [Polyangia bacterium]|nr:hypothetical protein [Polyangia bacterium]
TFTTSLGAGGVGTRIVDPSATTAAAPPPAATLVASRFIQAMASLDAAGPAHAAPPFEAWRHTPPTLISPRAQIA